MPNIYNPLTIKCIRLCSIVLMLWGLFGLLRQVYLILIIYPQVDPILNQVARHSGSSKIILQYAFFTSITNFITSAYAIALIIQPTKIVRASYFIVGIVLLIASLLVNTYYHVSPEVILNQASYTTIQIT